MESEISISTRTPGLAQQHHAPHLHESLLLLCSCRACCCCLVCLGLQVAQALAQLSHHTLRKLANLLNLLHDK
jgi:hypothetical protein